MSDFPAYPKTHRWFRDITITEKIDGSNALVSVRPATPEAIPDGVKGWIVATDKEPLFVACGSRERWIYPGKGTDNYGFAAFVEANLQDIAKLGPGNHYGEWWGQGIQRRYGMDKKVFSLFNVSRTEQVKWIANDQIRVVPTLYHGPLRMDPTLLLDPVQSAMTNLRQFGSSAAPGFMDPEGVIVYHHTLRTTAKVTFVDDHKGK